MAAESAPPTIATTAPDVPPAPATESENPNLPAYPLPGVLLYPSSAPPELITQGAEGRLYKTTYLLPSLPCALKYRPPKPYRHPILDRRLTRARILAEARILARCKRDGVVVPAVYAVDESAGWLMLEWIEGAPVRAQINDWLWGRSEEDVLAERDELVDLMGRMGRAVGKLHASGMVHGDLTTSNMMLRPPSAIASSGSSLLTDQSLSSGPGSLAPPRTLGRKRSRLGEDGHVVHVHTGAAGEEKEEGILDGEVVIIDFGLASVASHEEERAVDLYVLERAFGSTHPKAEVLFPELLEAYRGTYKQAPQVLRKLEDVRLRGRKRTMIG